MKLHSDITGSFASSTQARQTRRAAWAASLAYTHLSADEIFAEALREDSNRELDWLWVYVQVCSISQRRYCLERALAINPQSQVALRELRRLAQRLKP